MIKIEQLKREDLLSLLEQESTAYLKSYLTEESMEAMELRPHSYSIKDGDVLLACAGVTEYWPGRGEAWAVVTQSARNKFISLHNVVKRFLEVCPVDRIEAAVEIGFKNGHRWVNALGFELEAPLLKKYLPNGKDCSLYARVR